MMTAELLAPYIANTALTMQPFLLQTDNTITQIADHVWCKLRYSSSNGVATPAVASRHDCLPGLQNYLEHTTSLEVYLSRTNLLRSFLLSQDAKG